jgi:CRP-like cAMP-binding protein
LENEKLAEIIISMKLMRKSKNSCVYEQGDGAELVYLLVEGQLKMSKSADLFK